MSSPRYIDRASLVISKGQAALAAFAASRLAPRATAAPKAPQAATPKTPAYPAHWTTAAHQTQAPTPSAAGTAYPAHWKR